jgi:hypothetical protein
MAAASDPDARDVTLLLADLRRVMPGFETAQRIVACSHHAAPMVAFGFPGARHLWRSGPDGADLALLEVLENENVDQRFGQVTLCSGDGIFAETAVHLARAHVDVTVIARAGQLSRRLELAASQVIKLPDPPNGMASCSGECGGVVDGELPEGARRAAEEGRHVTGDPVGVALTVDLVLAENVIRAG